MDEIEVAEPSYEVDTEHTTPATGTLTVGSWHDRVPEPFESERLPPDLLPHIQRFLRTANLIESEEPRIAYICKFIVIWSYWVYLIDFRMLIVLIPNEIIESFLLMQDMLVHILLNFRFNLMFCVYGGQLTKWF